jgi:tRNA pseudouridine38-40 synthase
VSPAVRLRIDLAYDGTPFSGFARQVDVASVQETLEGALEQLLGQRARVTVAGRTDRGVHADAQVVHLDVDASVAQTDRWLRPAGALKDALQELCAALDLATPASIEVRGVRVVASDFDARFSATSRAYRYRLRDGVDPRRPVRGAGPERSARRDAPDVWGVIDELDVPAMRRGAQALLGEHDFSAFCRRAPGRTMVRRIDRIALRRLPAALDAHRIDISILGRAFCHQQVRAIVGCLVEVGRGRQAPDWIAAVLTARDRALAAPVAPPHGLTLESVTFGRGVPSAPPPGFRGRPGPRARVQTPGDAQPASAG